MEDNVTYYAKAFTGGTPYDVDGVGVDGDNLKDGDLTIAVIDGKSILYQLDADSGADASIPDVIPPAVNPGAKRWIRRPFELFPTTWLDSRAYSSLATAVAAADGAKEIKIFTNHTLTDDLTIDCPLTIEPGGIIDLDGHDLTINGPFKAGEYQVFTGEGTITGLSDVRVPWWGGLGDDSHDDSSAFSSALAAITEGGRVEFSPIGANIYLIDAVTASTANVDIVIPTGVTVKAKINYTDNGWVIKLSAAGCKITGGGILDGNDFTGGSAYYGVRIAADGCEVSDLILNGVIISGVGVNNLKVLRNKFNNYRYYALRGVDTASNPLNKGWVIEGNWFTRTNNSGADLTTPASSIAILLAGYSAAYRSVGHQIINNKIDVSALTDSHWAQSPNTAVAGISCRYVSDNVIADNIISLGCDGYGITELGRNSRVHDNIIIGNGLAAIGIEANDALGATVHSNVITGINNASGDGILLSDQDDTGGVLVSGNTINGCRVGIRAVHTSPDNTFIGNRIIDFNYHGFDLQSPRNVVQGGMISGAAEAGVWIGTTDANYNTVQGVTFTGDYSLGCVRFYQAITHNRILANVFRQSSGENIYGPGNNTLGAVVYDNGSTDVISIDSSTGNGIINLYDSNGDARVSLDSRAGNSSGRFLGPIEIGNTINVVSPTAPNRTINMKVGGVTYYLAAKTTND